MCQTGIVDLGLTADQVPKIVILHISEFHERLLFFIVQLVEPMIEKAGERNIDLEQAAPNTAPTQTFVVLSFHQTARRTIMSLILPIALVGFRPLGHTSTQFMIEWQRNRR